MNKNEQGNPQKVEYYENYLTHHLKIKRLIFKIFIEIRIAVTVVIGDLIVTRKTFTACFLDNCQYR